MRDNLHTYTEIVINISRKQNDNQKKLFKTAQDILMQLGGHNKDIIYLSGDEEYPYMNFSREIESVWRFRFVTKNIQNRHKKIFKKLQLKFRGRNIYCPYEEDGWRLILTRLAYCVGTIRKFIMDVNVQRLSEEEKKYFQTVKQKYKFVFEYGYTRRSIQKLVRKKDISTIRRQFNITSQLKKLENNPEIDTSGTQQAVDHILDILDKELFISQFEWVYKDINNLWQQKFGWCLFRKSDGFDSLKIPKDKKEFNTQLKDLHRGLVEALNRLEIIEDLKKLGVTDADLKNKEGREKGSISLLESWFFWKLKKNDLEIIQFLHLLNKLRVEIVHGLRVVDGLSGKEAFKKIVEFCQKKQSIQSTSVRSDVFKAILKTSTVVLNEVYRQIY
ncbi:MAG: hypothetical protein OXK80_05745 [Bdellovibrionales bacterium]|nr:hypothetical protein [Bdellovibrionales bacterium]